MNQESNNTDLQINKPEPITFGVDVIDYTRESDMQSAIDSLIAGKYILIREFYSNGLNLLNGLRNYLKEKHPNNGFQDQRAFRSEYQRLSNQVLITINKHQLMVKKAPSVGWIKKLYPKLKLFLLPFPQVQGLNSAWQWYVNGLKIPVLRNKLHPYYGVYFPTRFEHLHLLDNWLKRYKGPKKSAIDVGIGSGIISLQLMKYGFQKSFGTDVNPNAIVGMKEMMEGTKLAKKIELDYGHLFGKWDKQTELIVFNPPWLPASHELERLDEAIYYNTELFPEFFEEAKKRLLPEGRIVLLFSNLGQITKVTKEHPIEQELKDGNRFQLDKLLTKPVQNASKKTTRDQNWRSEEIVEMWVLKHG